MEVIKALTSRTLVGTGLAAGIVTGIGLDIWYQNSSQPIVYTAEAHEPEPREIIIETKIDWTPERIKQEYQTQAEKYGVSFEQMWNTVSLCENISLDPHLQSWHPDPTGPNGRENSWGLSQIHLDYHPSVTREQAQDPQFAAEFMAKKFSQGQANLWTCWREIYL